MPMFWPSSKKHEEERGTLLTKVDQLSTDNDKKSHRNRHLDRPRLTRQKIDFDRSATP